MADKDIRRPSDHSVLLQKLKVSLDKGRVDTATGPFDTYADVLAFAAVVGYRHGKPKSFEKSDEPIAWEIFENRRLDGLIQLLALAETGDPSVLTGAAGDHRKIEIFEGYANAGLTHLQGVVDKTGLIIDNVVDLILTDAGGGSGGPEDVDLKDLLGKKS